ncbi:MAG: flagellar basal body-associated FliL family protein [Acidiphilium sp.]|nr:flagellar basal body-associated FliL family protein [Acidiphilium sp.]MDD4935332.1 flagellar basal body-associated FliL family protein [Acidiphilium sp.]
MVKFSVNSKSTRDDSTEEAANSTVALQKRPALLLLGVPGAALLFVGGGLWISGILPHLLNGGKATILSGPVFVKIPEIVANLNVSSGQDSYAKLDATLELSNNASAAQVRRDMPRIIDVFQTYLRAMHPSELRGASGTYRLREALIDRVRIAVAPNVIRNVLFEELIVQ